MTRTLTSLALDPFLILREPCKRTMFEYRLLDWPRARKLLHLTSPTFGLFFVAYSTV